MSINEYVSHYSFVIFLYGSDVYGSVPIIFLYPNASKGPVTYPLPHAKSNILLFVFMYGFALPSFLRSRRSISYLWGFEYAEPWSL